MGWLDNLLSRIGYTKAGKEPQQKYPPFLLQTAGNLKYSLPDPSLYANQAELYQRLSWVNIAVSAVADTAATALLSVKRSKGEEDKDIPNHPFEELLKRPNPLQSRFELLRGTYSYYKLTGNAYWWLNRTNENAEPAEIWLIPTSNIKSVPDEKLFLKGYLYDPGDGQEIPLEPWEVTHFQSYNPNSMFVGLSPVEAIAQAAKNDMNQQRDEGMLYDKNNRGRLPGILAFKDAISDSDWLRMQEDVDKNAKLKQYLMLRNVGEGGVSFIQNTLSREDQQFIEGRKMNKEEIYSIFAPGLLSVLSENATEANARSGKATLIEMAIWPMLVMMAEKITNDIMPCYGEKLIAAFDDIRVTDRVLELSEIAEFSKTHTIDEIRKKYYQDKEIGDERGKMLPVQVSPTTILPEIISIEPEPAPAALQPGAPGSTQPEQPKPDETILEQVGENIGEAVGLTKGAGNELRNWQHLALKEVEKGRSPNIDFVPIKIPVNVYRNIINRLKEATDEASVKAAFALNGAITQPAQDYSELISILKEAIKVAQEV